MNIEPTDFNMIKTCGIISEQVGIILADKLGKLTMPVKNYYPSQPIAAGTGYTINLSVTTLVDATVTPITLTYIAAGGDTVAEVLSGLVASVSTEISITAVAVTVPPVENMYMYIVPNKGFSVKTLTTVGLSSDPKSIYVNTDQPACYLARGTQPTSGFPRIVITPLASHDRVCQRFAEGSVDIGGVYHPYVDSYLTYSVNLTCEAGHIGTVLETGESAQDILNTLRKRLQVGSIRKALFEASNSTFLPPTSVTSSPVIEMTEYMDIAKTTLTGNTIDRYVDINGGLMEIVEMTAGTYKIEDTTVMTTSTLTIDRNAT